jgi:hypothetical protein
MRPLYDSRWVNQLVVLIAFWKFFAIVKIFSKFKVSFQPITRNIILKNSRHETNLLHPVRIAGLSSVSQNLQPGFNKSEYRELVLAFRVGMTVVGYHGIPESNL